VHEIGFLLPPHSELETKGQSMKWSHPQSPRKEDSFSGGFNVCFIDISSIKANLFLGFCDFFTNYVV
jgi:hypothetical protein